jgi:hypothetical protein
MGNKGGGLWGLLCGLLVTSMMFLAGCDRGDKVDLQAVDAPIRELLARHDAYVKADKNLEKVDKDIYIRTSDLVRRVLDTAHKKVAPKTTAAFLYTEDITGNGNHYKPVQVGVSKVYQLEDPSNCQKDGTCAKTAISTKDLASEGLYFASKSELDAYLKGMNKKVKDKDLIQVQMTEPDKRQEIIKGLEAGERLYDKYATKI